MADELSIPQGKLLQLPPEEAVKWVQGQLATSTALKLLHKHFSGQGYVFHVERARVFVGVARNARDDVTPTVLGILPSFLPVTAADERHAAVGISVHQSGYALATSVNVEHRPFGVTEFTLHEIDPKSKAIKTSTLSADALNQESVGNLAGKLHKPFLPARGRRSARGTKSELAEFTALAPGDQGLMVGSVVQQLLAENYSRGFFPPEYARALTMQTPTFQKFALATRERFKGTVLGLTLCTSSSTSSNICTSTSTSTIEI